jgi:predicted NBD/HSP70 family sugar kinase
MSRLADDWLRLVLRTLYQQRMLTRQDLLLATGLNPASVSHAVRHLLERGVVVKTGEVESKGGRARDVLDLNTEAGYFIAVDLEGTSIRFALTNLVGDIRFRFGQELDPGQGINVETVSRGVELILDQLSGLQRARLLACGVSHPGMSDQQGRITAVNLRWDSLPLEGELRRKLKIPVYVENAHRTCILAERWLGAAKDKDNSIYLIVGNGIGIGAFVDGKILEGYLGIAGEFGHMTIDPNAQDLCFCGRRGCLEAIASCASIVRQYFAETANTSAPLPASRVTDVFDRARQGDRTAQSILDRAGKYLGLGLAHLVLLLNPEVIVIGGDILSGADLMLDRIRREMELNTLPAFLPGLELKPSSLGLDIGLKGATALAFRESLKESQFLRNLAGGFPQKQRASKKSQKSPSARVVLSR